MTLNIGVIGTGAIGREHIRRLSHTLLGSRVVAVTDINADQAARDLVVALTKHNVTPEEYAVLKKARDSFNDGIRTLQYEAPTWPGSKAAK